MSIIYSVVCLGDSITAADNSYAFQGLSITPRGNSTTALEQSRAFLSNGGNILFWNMAVAGQTITSSAENMTLIATTYVDPMFATRHARPSGSGGARFPKRKYILSFFPGSNDGCLGVRASVADFVALDVVPFIADRRRAGFDAVILGTCLPRADPGAALDETRRGAYNTIIKGAGWAQANGVDGIFDIGSDALMGDIATCSNTTYYDVAKIHPTTVGAAILAPIWRATLDAVIARL